MELLTAAQMRAIEQAAIDSGEVTGLELMERAGRGVVEAIFEWRPELAASPGKAVVLCGPGNNGGDGFVVARLLHGQGWDVDVYLFGDEAKLPPDAAENCRRWRELGDIRDASQSYEDEAGKQLHLAIDALFGTGLSRPISDPALWERLWLFDDAIDVREWHENGRPGPLAPPFTVSIDVPSGLCADSGKVLGSADHGVSCPRAMLSVTFHRPKLGHMLADGLEYCGRLVVKNIGLVEKRSSLDDMIAKQVCDPTDWLGKGGDHKYSHGHTLVLSGGVGKGGAARLAARGALRIGAGLATVGVPPSALIENAAQLNSIMLARMENPDALFDTLQDVRINSVVLGPGLGISEKTREMALIALKSTKRSVVLDADALTVFQGNPAELFDATRGRNVVLTPHLGEFRRLFPDLAETLASSPTKGPAYSKTDAGRDAASRAGCIVLLKGPDTVVADPHGAVSVIAAAYDRACPWLATAGAGDVLAGFIGGLLARGLAPKSAAETAAWLHQECAREFGPGLIAEDLPETLPRVFRNLGL